jgi:hypothetical protein
VYRSTALEGIEIGIGSSGGCKGKVVQEILSNIRPSCIVLSSKKLRANIRMDGRKPVKGIGHRVYKINFQFEKVKGIFFPSS